MVHNQVCKIVSPKQCYTRIDFPFLPIHTEAGSSGGISLSITPVEEHEKGPSIDQSVDTPVEVVNFKASRPHPPLLFIIGEEHQRKPGPLQHDESEESCRN
jgi:hypothetical protein